MGHRTAIVFILLSSALVVAGTTTSFAQEDHQMDMNESSPSTSVSSSSPIVYPLLNSNVLVKLSWEPNMINPNGTTMFTFEFLDADFERPLENVTYSVHMAVDGKSVGHGHEGVAPNGVGTLEQEFDSTGSLSIIVESIKVRDVEIDEVAQFNLVVVPEFPMLFVGMIVSVGLMGSIVASRLLFRKI